MGLHDERNRHRREEFHSRLKGLMGEYPEMFEPPDDVLEHMAMEHEDFNLSSPQIITGLVLVYCTQNLERFEQIFWTDPAEQVHWLSLGMLNSAQRVMEG